MILQENVNQIRDKYGVEYLLRQLAEECGELAVAILHLIRAMRRERYMTVDDARIDVMEEIAYVRVMLDCLEMGYFSDGDRERMDFIADAKANRMVKRLLGDEENAQT